jgi:hypothetical protein
VPRPLSGALRLLFFSRINPSTVSLDGTKRLSYNAFTKCALVVQRLTITSTHALIHAANELVILSESKDLSRKDRHTPSAIAIVYGRSPLRPNLTQRDQPSKSVFSYSFDFQLPPVTTSKISPQSRSPYRAARASSSLAANSFSIAPTFQTSIRKP